MTTTNKTALVTGANKGIGFETARQLAEQGFTVWAGCRDQQRGETAVKALSAYGDVRLVSLDVTDTASVAAAVKHIAAFGALDALINNAGVAVPGSGGLPSTVHAEAIERSLEVNFYGTLRVIQQFLPLVRRSEAGRIVNVSTTLASIGTLVSPDRPLAPFGPTFAYPASKTMLNALTGWLAVELDGTGIKVNSVCPGYNATDMNGHSGTQHPAEGAKAIVTAATLPDDGPTGTFFDMNGPVPW